MNHEAHDVWHQTLGDDGFVGTAEAVWLQTVATFAVDAQAAAVLRPATLDQLRECLAVARACGARLYLRSCGLNWGLGSAAPPEDGAVLLKLDRMTQIVEYDDRLGLLTVEPGVTFSQVDEFLQARRSRFFLPAIGGPPHASVIGNALDRGHGIGPVVRRVRALESIEAMLADGEIVSSAGLGPLTVGLFVQSSLAIVTRATFRLCSIPRHLTMFAARPRSSESLGVVVESLSGLLLRNVLCPRLLTCWNGYQAVAMEQTYPCESIPSCTPPDLTLCGRKNTWQFSGALYAETESIASGSLAALDEVLDVVTILSEGQPGYAQTSPRFLGRPSESNLQSLYWQLRSGRARTGDPHADGCGLFWVCPRTGTSACEIDATIYLIESTILRHGFAPCIGFTVDDPLDVELFVAIHFDRLVEGEERRARLCHDGLLEDLEAAGLSLYRRAVISKRPLAASGLRARLKVALDPNNMFVDG